MAAAAGEVKESKLINAGEESECPFSMDAMQNAVCVSCGHRGCMPCLASVIDTVQNGCPTCRAEAQQVIRFFMYHGKTKSKQHKVLIKSQIHFHTMTKSKNLKRHWKERGSGEAG